MKHCLQIQTFRLCISKCFTYSGERACDHDLIRQLTVLSASCCSLVVNIGSHCFKQRHTCFKIFFVSTHKDRKCSCLCTGISSGYRGIQNMKSPLIPLFINLLGNLRTGGCHIDQIRTFFCAVQNIPLIEIHFFHVLRKSHNGDHCLTVFHAVCNAVMKSHTLCDHIFYLCFCSCINVQIKTCLFQIPHHGFSHDPDSDKPDLFHFIFPHYCFSTTSPCFL